MSSDDFVASVSSETSVKFHSSYVDGQPYSDVLGKRRTFGGLSFLEWAFLLVSTANVVATIGITIERMTEYGKNMPSADFTFALLLFVNALFCIFYVYNGVLRELTFEIIAFMASIAIVLGYCIVEYILNHNGRSVMKLIRLIISCVLAPVNLYLAGKVATHFGWLEFRIAGASEILQHMYRLQKAFFSLQRFDFQAAVSFVILGLQQEQIFCNETFIMIAGIVILVIWMVIGFIAVKKEINWLVYMFMLLSVLDPIYVIAKVTIIYIRKVSYQEDIKDIIFYPFLTVGATTLLVRAILVAELAVVFRNFNKGLGDQAFQELVASETTALLSGRVRRQKLCCFKIY